jgi:hypothetical protein
VDCPSMRRIRSAAAAAAILLACSTATPLSSSSLLDLQCSYHGEHTRAGCECVSPWRGSRCNELPEPLAGQPRDAAHYMRLLPDTFVASCDPLDPHEYSDCTDGLAEALRQSGEVLVPKLTNATTGSVIPWRTRGFVFDADDARVTFEAGVEVLALKNATYLFACKPVADLATANHRRNVSIVGYGASWRMWREDYVARCKHSEFRMGLAMSNCSDMEVAGLTISETGGDGIIVMSDIWHCTNYSKPGGECILGVYKKGGASRRVLIRDVVLDKNYRQGMSVISAQDLLVIVRKRLLCAILHQKPRSSLPRQARDKHDRIFPFKQLTRFLTEHDVFQH